MKTALEVDHDRDLTDLAHDDDDAASVGGHAGGTAMNSLDRSIVKAIFVNKTLTSAGIYEALSVESLSPDGILELFQRIHSLKNRGLIVEDSAYGRIRYELTDVGRMQIFNDVDLGENLGV
jgi:hypothetical protein